MDPLNLLDFENDSNYEVLLLDKVRYHMGLKIEIKNEEGLQQLKDAVAWVSMYLEAYYFASPNLVEDDGLVIEDNTLFDRISNDGPLFVNSKTSISSKNKKSNKMQILKL